ncbi:MAG: ABC transporter transmembrane domain-containing protein, partial [Acidimicrobiia bacterium]|nr:ABC transporter transmembrane domain-containing protein [Acidimicrobiia bacterium]
MASTTPWQIMHSMSRTDDASAVELRPGTTRRVWRYARPYKAMITGFVISLVLIAVLSLLPPLLFGRIIDGALIEGDRSQLNRLGLILLVAAFAVAGIGLLERFWSSRIGEGLIYDLRVELFDHVQRMPIGFFTATQTGTLISRLNNDVIGAQRAFTGTLGTVVGNMIGLVTTLIAMFALEWRLTLLALLLLPMFVWPAKRVGRNLQSITREGMNLNASMNTTMTERFGVAGALLVKLFGRHDQEQEEFADRAGRVRDIGVRSAMYSRSFVTALNLVGAVGTVLVYWLGGTMVINGTITIGTLTALSLLVAGIYTPLTSLSTARVDIMTAFVSFERVFEIIDLPNPIAEGPDAQPLPPVTGEIRFDHVSFAYPPGDDPLTAANEAGPTEESEVLHDIDLTIEPGQLVAIVGPSGAGKSTLTSLVPRLYDVTDGAVTVDGIDVRDSTLASLRAAIGVVSQDPHLFHD